MAARTAAQLRDELDRLMREHIESLRGQVFGGMTPEEIREQ
jgi:hypothetical protein